MPHYVYEAVGRRGDRLKGELSAADEAAALASLAQSGLTILDISEGRDEGPWWSREISLGRTGLPPAELQAFLRTFATLLDAGFPLVKALRFAEGEAPSPRARRVLGRLTSAVEGGASLGEALSGEDAVPDHIRTALALGENANDLPRVAAAIEMRLSAQIALAREIRGALLYPAILLVMSLLVLALLVFYLAPALRPVFETTGEPVPTTLAALDGLRLLLVDHWPVVLVAITGSVVIAVSLRARLGAVRRVVRLVPVISGWEREGRTMGLVATIAMLLESGAAIDKAVDAAAAAAGPVDGPALRDIAEEIRGGAPLSGALAAAGLAGPTSLAMIRAGEEADRVPDMLRSVERTLESRIAARTKAATQLLTPVLTLTIGLLVAGLILSVIGAILDLNDAAL